MTTKQITEKEVIAKIDLPAFGGAINHDLAAKMVKDYQDANPNKKEWHFIGKNIISEILSQPGCVGVKFYNAINEAGIDTLVYVGIDAEGKDIYRYTFVGDDGDLYKQNGIVADLVGWSVQL